MSNVYIDKAQCPNGHEFTVRRRRSSEGWIVGTRCPDCRTTFDTVAGAPTEAAKPSRESQVEARLVQAVKKLGGEVRKVKWEGRRGAPDRLVMLPGVAEQFGPGPGYALLKRARSGRTIWIELKAPGGAATFPKNAREKAQHREHERMRKMGQRVEVVDSYERIEELLK